MPGSALLQPKAEVSRRAGKAPQFRGQIGGLGNTQHRWRDLSDRLVLLDWHSRPCMMCQRPCRVIRRLAAPTAMANMLPEGTVHYGCKVVDVTTTPSGVRSAMQRCHHLQLVWPRQPCLLCSSML